MQCCREFEVSTLKSYNLIYERSERIKNTIYKDKQALAVNVGTKIVDEATKYARSDLHQNFRNYAGYTL